jgi:TolB-like protein
LPFRHRGPAEQRYISEALGDELIDVLTTMRGLRVSASGATARFVENESGRDPRAIGHELGVELVVDATATVAGSRIQIAARLLDVASNSQLWSERYDSNLTDVFELQDKLGKRIGEALRLEILHLTHRQLVPDAAIDVYLRARASSRENTPASLQQTVELFERCLELAPGFRPALSGYAIACLRRWFMPVVGGRNWAEAVEVAVEAARNGAGELAETHLAIAMLAVQKGDYRAAAAALQQALQIAPTYAAAHDYLGRLQLEAGRPERGIRHTQLAWELDPSLVLCLRDLSRYHALRGDREQFLRWWAEIVRSCPERHPIFLQEHRIATWFRDTDWAARVFARLADTKQNPEVLTQMAMYHRTDITEPKLRDSMVADLRRAANPRLRSLLCQFYCEGAAWHGFDALALDYLSEAADGVLVDLDWLDHCPLLDRLRDRDEFARARMIVADRADAIWAG